MRQYWQGALASALGKKGRLAKSTSFLLSHYRFRFLTLNINSIYPQTRFNHKKLQGNVDVN